MTDPTRAEVLAALELPPDAVIEPAAGGASGAAWRVRTAGTTYALRRSSPAQVECRIAAMAAARRAGLPAPELIRRARAGDQEVVLLTWLPGIPMLDAIGRTPLAAHEWGRRMGELQRRVHAVQAPEAVTAVTEDPNFPFRAGVGLPVPDGNALLHLDWHPLNLLVDEERGTITGIVDWDNARRGSPLLDVARTHAILTMEPLLDEMPEGVRHAIPSVFDGWADGYGPEARGLPMACAHWAATVMLADLERRYADRPNLLDPIRSRIVATATTIGA